ncbi:MAG: diguanylate cyclase [Coriobacteriales bacterium]|jgi:diguanylate cyclase (GGDEF)-like protein
MTQQDEERQEDQHGSKSSRIFFLSPSASLFYVIGLFAIVFAFLCFTIPQLGGTEYNNDDDYVDVSDGWVDEEGNQIDPSNVSQCSSFLAHQPIVIHRTLPEDLPQGAMFQFLSRDCSLDVTIGSQSYSYHPYIPPIVGKSSGPSMHSVALPSSLTKKNRVVTITIYPDYYDGSARVEGLAVATNVAYTSHVVTLRMIEQILQIATILIGIAAIVLALALPATRDERGGLLHLGILTVLVGGWITTQTMMLQYLLPQPTYVYLMQYYLLAIVPFSAMSFVGSNVPVDTSKFRNIIAVLCTADLVIIIVSPLLGGPDAHQLLPITHFILLLLAVFIVISLVRSRSILAIQTHESGTFTWIIWLAAAALLSSSLCDLFRLLYEGKSIGDAAMFTRVGYLVFALLCIVYYLSRIIYRVKKGQLAETYERLAYTDALTMLGNRLAFELKEQSLDTDSAVCVVALDINNLKEVNDTYGHIMGDTFIKAAGNCLDDSFGQEGSCYRVGGDEFVAILEGDDLLGRFESCCFELRVREQEVRELLVLPVPLSVACGMAIRKKGEDISLHELCTLADERMYEDKNAHKDSSEGAGID